MSIGTGIALFVVGAILFFAVQVHVAFVDLQTVGLILMLAGAVVFVVGLILLFVRRSSVSRTEVDPTGRSRTTRTTDGNF